MTYYITRKNLDINNNTSPEPGVPYKTQWKHFLKGAIVEINPFTSINILVEQLQKAIEKKDDYTSRQQIDLKQFYFNAKKSNGEVKKQIAQGWTIEYFKKNQWRNGNFVESFSDYDKSDTLRTPIEKVWVHKYYPFIPVIEQQSDESLEDLVNKLNQAVKVIQKDYFDKSKVSVRYCYTIAKQFLVDNLPSPEEENEFQDKLIFIKKYADYLGAFAEIKEIKRTGVINVLQGRIKSSSDWSLKELKDELFT